MGEAKRRRNSKPITWTAGSHHTLIVEWLREDERKTGSELADRLASWSSDVILKRCQSGRDVVSALEEALLRLRETGKVPVIHLEAHGLEAPNAGDDSGLGGPDGKGGEEHLLWRQIAPLLGQINLASQFQLLLVGAACYGLTALDCFDIAQPAPFSALIGFASKVAPRTLFEGMVELYRQLLKGGHGSIPDAVKAANRELNSGEFLATTSFFHHACAVLVSYAKNELEPSHREAENRRMARIASLEMGRPVSAEEMRKTHRSAALHRCKEAVAIWFAYRELTENRDRFCIDVKRIFEQQEEIHRRKII